MTAVIKHPLKSVAIAVGRKIFTELFFKTVGPERDGGHAE